MSTCPTTRRDFLKRSIAGGLGLAAGWRTATLGGTAYADEDYTATVAITKGDDRADNAFRAMQIFKKEIAAAIGDKRVIVKANLVEPTIALACTDAAWLEGILEFLKSIGKTNVAIAESSPANTMRGFDQRGYYQLANKYAVRLMDLNQEGYQRIKVWYAAADTTPNTTIRVCKLYFNPRNFLISAARIKTHNFAVATLSLKYIAMSAPTVDIGKNLSQPWYKDDKWAGMHGEGGSQVLTDNIYRLAKVYGIHPHLAVIDGYQGMQGDGPTGGYAIDPPQKLGIASLDWVAADRVCVSLMGHDGYVLNSTGPYPACLNYCAQAGMGEWDISKIRVIGEPIAGNVVNYVPHSTVASQLGLRTAPRE